MFQIDVIQRPIQGLHWIISVWNMLNIETTNCMKTSTLNMTIHFWNTCIIKNTAAVNIGTVFGLIEATTRSNILKFYTTSIILKPPKKMLAYSCPLRSQIRTRMYPLMFPQRAAVRERLPTEAARVGPLARVDADVNLLRAPRTEHLACT